MSDITNSVSEEEATRWLFAYGSLIWRPGFNYEARVRGYVPGFKRRFWQASTDHRGVPEQPGRVVTLVPDERAQCWGVSYRLSAQERARVLSQLDDREKGGYILQRATFVAQDRTHSGTMEVLVYVGKSDNPSFVGEATLDEIADVVRQAAGPSGHNVEYVLRLAEALSDLGVEDDHVFELANRLVDPAGATDE